MRILSLKATDYRSLEDVTLDLSRPYTAVCGPNDSGKTNVIRAIKTFVSEDGTFRVEPLDDEDDVSIEKDFPKWKTTPAGERQIGLALTLEVNADRDAALFQFLTKQLSLEEGTPDIVLTIKETYKPDQGDGQPDVEVSVGSRTFDGLPAQEVRKRLRNSRAILFHNSTQTVAGFPFRSTAGGLVQAEKAGHSALLGNMKKTVDRGLAKVAKTHKKELEGLLGRLKTKYIVGLSMPSFDFGFVPLRVTLGQKQLQVPLDDWGSGTRNRTMILMALFRARRMSQMAASAEKITPVIVIEEPESFLHPSAQAEFGRLLQDIAQEFGVQVVVTTHSPYLLNLTEPDANVLLCRSERRRQLQETTAVDTSGENWMEPFAAALGLNAEEFRPWKALMMSGADAVLLVEGKTDKEYFELLRDPAHGSKALQFAGEIIPYEGIGNLQNSILLKFVRTRYQKVFLTFDLDALGALEKTLKVLGLQKRKHFEPLGINEPGKREIEGLLPDEVVQSVYLANHHLVQALTSSEKAEQRGAKNELKKLLLDQFKSVAVPGDAYYSRFYPVAKVVNQALK